MFDISTVQSEICMEYYNYWTFDLPIVISKVMCSNFEDASIVPLVNSFLVNVLKYIINNPSYDIRATKYDASNYSYQYNCYDYCLYLEHGEKCIMNSKLKLLNKILNNEM